MFNVDPTEVAGHKNGEMVSLIKINDTKVRVEMGGKLCEVCVFRKECPHRLALNYASVVSVADEVTVSIEVTKCDRFLKNKFAVREQNKRRDDDGETSRIPAKSYVSTVCNQIARPDSDGN